MLIMSFVYILYKVYSIIISLGFKCCVGNGIMNVNI